MPKIIQTSNYARNGNNPNALAISYSCPKWYTGKRLPELAPTWYLVGGYKVGDIGEKEYVSIYLEILQDRKLTPEKILDIIPNDSILLCYESPSDFCHRRVLAEWVTLKTGFVIPEWKNDKEVLEGEQQQIVDSLFDF